MPVSSRTKLKIQQRCERVAALFLQNWTQSEIAKELGVSQATISSDLQRIQHEWRESAIRDFDLLREMELRRIDYIYRQAAEGWVRSQKPEQAARLKGAGREAEKTIRNRDGNPQFLEVLLKCSAQRCLLMGLNVPQPMLATNIAINLSPEERERHVQAVAAEIHRKIAGSRESPRLGA